MPAIAPPSTPPIRARLITKTGTQEISRDADARIRAESWIESETAAVHTLMYADGTYSVWTYTRGSEGRWVRDSSLAGNGEGVKSHINPRGT